MDSKALKEGRCYNYTRVADAKRATKNAIKLYKEIRLYLYLDFRTPNIDI